MSGGTAEFLSTQTKLLQLAFWGGMIRRCVAGIGAKMGSLDDAVACVLVNEQMIHVSQAPCLWGNSIQFLLLIDTGLCDVYH